MDTLNDDRTGRDLDGLDKEASVSMERHLPDALDEEDSRSGEDSPF